MVDKPVGLHSGVEDQVRAEDVDVRAGEKDGGVNTDLSTVEEVFFIAASINTSGIYRGYVDQTVAIPINTCGIDRGYVDQTVAIPINTPGIDRGYVDQTMLIIPISIFFVEGCCKDSSDYQQEDELHVSVGRTTLGGDFIPIFTFFRCETNYQKPNKR